MISSLNYRELVIQYLLATKNSLFQYFQSNICSWCFKEIAQYTCLGCLTLYLTEAPFDAFPNRANPDQTEELPDQGLLCLPMEI